MFKAIVFNIDGTLKRDISWVRLTNEIGGSIEFNDPVVKFTELTKFQEKLPNAKFTILDNRGHFNQPHFPEIISDITALSI